MPFAIDYQLLPTYDFLPFPCTQAMAGSMMPTAMRVKNAPNTLQVTSFSFNAFPSFSFKQKLLFISLIYHVNSFYKGLYLCHGTPGIHSVKFDNFGVPYQVASMSLQRILVKLRI